MIYCTLRSHYHLHLLLTPFQTRFSLISTKTTAEHLKNGKSIYKFHFYISLQFIVIYSQLYLYRSRLSSFPDGYQCFFFLRVLTLSQLHRPAAVPRGPLYTLLQHQLGLPSLTTRGRSGANKRTSATAKSRTRFTHTEKSFGLKRTVVYNREQRSVESSEGRDAFKI